MARPTPSGSKAIVLLALSLMGVGLAVWAVVVSPPLFHREAHALFETSVTRAAAHPVVINTLGGPVKRGVLRNHEISGTGLTGTGHFVGSLSGSRSFR